MSHPPSEPLILIGTGRTGSRVLHRLLARHPDLTWASRACERAPNRLRLQRQAVRLSESPLIGGLIRRRFPPGECYGFWNHYFPGFGNPSRDLRADDVTATAKTRLRQAWGELAVGRRRGLLIKLTGWPRISFLREVFPNARFIHLVRDGRAVANSLLAVDWWWGWQGPSNWHFGPLTREEERLWEEHDRSYVVLAGIQWRKLVDAVEAARAAVPPNQVLQLRYEDLCRDPVRSIGSVLEFGGLQMSRRFEIIVQNTDLRDANYKWREDLTPDQQESLTRVLSPYLRRYGYL